MMALEETFQVTVDEAQLRRRPHGGRPGGAGGQRGHSTFPAGLRGNAECPRSARSSVRSTSRPGTDRCRRGRCAASACRPGSCRSRGRFLTPRRRGLEHLDGIDGPVIFAANHQSHLDTPAILRALPPRWRYRLAPAMAKEFFKAHFFPGQFDWKARLTNSANYYLASLFFNAFPLPQREAGTRQTLRYIGELIERGLLGPDLSRGQADRRGRDQPVSAWGGYDCVQAGRSRSSRSGSRAWTESSTSPGSSRNGAGRGSLSGRLCC